MYWSLKIVFMKHYKVQLLSVYNFQLQTKCEYFKVNKLTLFFACCLNQAFADAVSILEKDLFEGSATDVNKGEDSFNLLQKIIPSFVGK